MNINYTQIKQKQSTNEQNNKTITLTPFSINITLFNLLDDSSKPLISSSLLKHKYSMITNQYTLMKINNIIYNKKSHLVAVFKDNLLSSIDLEFIKRFYERDESRYRIKAYSEYYKNYLEFFCRPLFNGYYHNNTMVRHYERHAEFHYNNQYSIRQMKHDKKKYKSRHRNMNEINTIFSESIKNNLNKTSLSNNDSRVALNCNNNAKNNIQISNEIKEDLMTSFTNWSFILKNNNHVIANNTIEHLFTNESIVSCIPNKNANHFVNSNNANINVKDKERLHHHNHISKFKDILNAKPNINLEESKLRNKNEQFRLILNKIIHNERGRKCQNLIMKNIQIKNSISVKSIHKKPIENNKDNHVIKYPLEVQTINNLKRHLVLSHVNSTGNIPKLSLDICCNGNNNNICNKGRNKQKQVISQPKELVKTTSNHNKTKKSTEINHNSNCNNMHCKLNANIAHKKSKEFNKKLFIYNYNTNTHTNMNDINHIISEKDNDMLLNTRNKKQIEKLQLIPQISHNKILKSLSNNKNRITHTLQKIPIDKPDLFQAFFQKDRLNSLNLKRKDIYHNLSNNANLMRFKSETFVQLSSSSIPKNNSLKTKPKSIKLQLKK